jgi:hypothetical protein
MTTSPPDRSMTVRAALLAELRHGPITARELSARVRIPERDVAEHLAHIERSLHKSKEPLCTEPPSCLSCGFVFRKRERLTRPGSCPKCRGTHIEAPRFWIESRAQEPSRRDDDLPGDGSSDGSDSDDGSGGGAGEESGD